MNYRFSSARSTHNFILYGYTIVIEYRPRLKAFDLVFYPNLHNSYGRARFTDKVVCRSFDFTALCAIIIKTSEAFANSKLSFSRILKLHVEELNSETPAQ